MKRNRRLLLRWGLVMAVLGGIAPVIHAATVTTTLPVTANVVSACTVTASGVNFGTYTGTAVNANGSITVNCASGTSYFIALNAGDHPIDNLRGLSSGGAFLLPYRLFSDAALTAEWGDFCFGSTYPAGACNAGSGIGSPQLFTVYGQAQGGGSGLPVGEYTDTVLVTVLF